MNYNPYSHCFTKCQLERIIDEYLGLRPYYCLLLTSLDTYMHRLSQQPLNFHTSNKPHPIRIPEQNSLRSNNSFQDIYHPPQSIIDQQSKICDLRQTYNSTNTIRYFYIYPLETIVSLLESQQFYREVPKHVIVNGLLTATNVQIIIETLTIISEEMSKKIKTTLAARTSNKKYSKDQIYIEQKQKHKSQDNRQVIVVQPPQINAKQPTELNLQSPSVKYSVQFLEQSEQNFVQIIDLSQQQIQSKASNVTHLPQSKPIQAIHQDLSKRLKPNPPKPASLTIQSSQIQCTFCRNYLYYLSQTTKTNLNEQSLHQLSPEAIRRLNLISQTVNHFTLHLLQTQRTKIPNNIHLINRILNNFGIVITEDIYASELNPKNHKNTTIAPPHKPKNLIEQLQPYFWMVNRKPHTVDDQNYSIEQLFRMIIYCPTTKQVAQQLRTYQKRLFYQQRAGNKNLDSEQQLKLTSQQGCKHMIHYQRERLKIAQNIVNKKTIYKQIQFEQSSNIFNPNTNLNVQDITGNKNFVADETSSTTKVNCNHKRTDSTRLNYLLSQQKTNKKSRNINQKKDRRTHQKHKTSYALQSNEDTAVSRALSRNTIKNTSNHDKTRVKTGLISGRISQPPQTDQQQLSNDHFRHMLFTASLRKKTAPQKYINVNSPPPTPCVSILQNAAAPFCKTQKKSTYSSSLSQLRDRKHELEQIQCLERMEKENFNKQLLNGHSIKIDVYQQLKKDNIKIYKDFQSTELNSRCVGLRCIDLRNTKKVDCQKYMELINSNAKVIQSDQKRSNFIEQTSIDYNQTGLIRNQRYNKNIRAQLINHRPTFLAISQKENLKASPFKPCKKELDDKIRRKQELNVKQTYQQQLKRLLKGQQHGQQTQHY